MDTYDPSVFDTDRRKLATLFDLSSDGAERLWKDEELGAILRHQLSAPMQVDLISLKRGLALNIRRLAESLGLTLKSFGDLLAHPNPPIELLELTKDFAKACRLNPHGPVLPEVASVLYFASIAASMVNCHRRISRLSNDDLLSGFHWVLTRSWLDAPTRTLMEKAVCLLHDQSGHDDGKR